MCLLSVATAVSKQWERAPLFENGRVRRAAENKGEAGPFPRGMDRMKSVRNSAARVVARE